jgi:hypothetical protein
MIVASGLSCPLTFMFVQPAETEKKERYAIQHTSGITNSRMTTPALAINK